MGIVQLRTGCLPYIRRQVDRHSYGLALAGIIVYNNWIIGALLNWRGTLAGATTSGLEATGQPWAVWFRLMDVAAGALLLLGMGSVVRLGHTRRQRELLLLGMGALGVSTIVETLIPLGCSASLSSSCALHEQLGLVGWQSALHLYESPVAYAMMLLLPLTVAWATRRHAAHARLRRLSWLLIIFMLVWCAETVVRFMHHAVSFGYEQRLFNILFAWWFIVAIRARVTGNNPRHPA